MHHACSRILGKGGFTVECRSESGQILDLIAKRAPDVVLTAIRMPEKNGFQVLEAALSSKPALPVIAITTRASIPEAVAWLKAGGANYLAAPFGADQLVRAVEDAVTASPFLAARLEYERPESRKALEAIIGRGQAVSDLKKTVVKIARTDANVLIRGETGVGKELVARAIHELSSRSAHTFLPADCAAIPPNLLESELFGHEKGAFTGAHRSRCGLFEAAGRGTIFLDEIGELDVSTQSKLFRVLEEGKIRQIGGRHVTPVDVRVIAATNRNLEAELREGSFRSELYFRLSVVTIKVPPLRQRGEDIPLLANHFFVLYKRLHRRDDLTGMDDSVMDALITYRWPGNVRELKNAIERAVVLSDGPVIRIEDLPDEMACEHDEADAAIAVECEEGLAPYAISREQVLDSFDRHYFRQLLALYGGNLSEAARRSGIGRKTLYNKLKQVGVFPIDFSGQS